MRSSHWNLVVIGTGLFCALVSTSCTHRGSQDGYGFFERKPAGYSEDPASTYGTEEYARAFVPQNEAEMKIKKFIEEQNPKSNGHVEFPPGLTGKEASELWHISEGSDVFPLRWFFNVKSATVVPELVGTPLYQKLDQKFGLINEDSAHNPYKYKHNYPLKTIGLSAAWSDANPTDADAFLSSSDEDVFKSDVYSVKTFNGRKSVAMVGTNCAFCHTGQVQVGNHVDLVEGAPAMASFRGFFQDLIGSTVKTMLDPKETAELIRRIDPKANAARIAQAEQLAKDFKVALMKSAPAKGKTFIGTKIKGKLSKLKDGASDFLESDIGKHVVEVVQSGTLPKTKKLFTNTLKKRVAQNLFERRAVTAEYLTKLLALSYDIPVNEVSPTLKKRMAWLAALVGADPKLKVTNEGYARTDAFGRISNWVARGDNPVELTATVSVPPMWAIRYRPAFHWNSNTNSVIQRNIGQSFGLGAILTGDGVCSEKARHNCQTTANLHNLNRLESLLYKLEIPNWEKKFKNSPVNMKLAIPGCNTFQKTCAGCHDSKPLRVGPGNALIDAKIHKPESIGVDPWYAQLQGTPVTLPNGTKVPFREALFAFTKNVRDEYFAQHKIDEKQVDIWQRAEIRGDENFRDTYLGAPPFGRSQVDYMKLTGPGYAYTSRNLAGVWATAPYLHNGSVQNLYALLQPASQRPRFFFLGPKEYDADVLGFVSHAIANKELGTIEKYTFYGDDISIRDILAGSEEERHNRVRCLMNMPSCFDASEKGNSNKGHEYGVALSDQEKRELIEFMKILRPDQEYSWTTPPRYKVIGLDKKVTQRTCEEVDIRQFQ